MQNARTVLITGASTGIGAAIATRLAREGYRVFGTTRRLNGLAEAPAGLKDAITEAAPAGLFPVRFVELDVTKPESVDRCVGQVLTEAGRIDVLINSAGWAGFGPIEDLPLETAQAMFDTTVFGALRMIRAVVPAMRERGSGLILNITSICARTVIPFQSHYSAAKAALEALTIGLRHELKPFGVGVVSLEPSDINTRFNDVTVFPPAKTDAYRPWNDPVWKLIAENLPKSPPPEVVAVKVSAILRARKPKPIYTCGIFYQRIAPTVFRFVPKSLEYRLMRLFYGLGFK